MTSKYKSRCGPISKSTKTCIRQDGKLFTLPRKFSRNQCKVVKGFTILPPGAVEGAPPPKMRASCAPYKMCKKKVAVKKNAKFERMYSGVFP